MENLKKIKWAKEIRGTYKVIVAAVIIAFLVFVLLISAAPDDVPYSPNNYGWNGVHNLYSSFNIVPVNSIFDLPLKAQKSVLLIVQPTGAYSQSEGAAISSFVTAGGSVVDADNLGQSNSLLAYLGVGVAINQDLMIQDHTYNWKDPSLPIALVPTDSRNQFSFLSNVGAIALDVPSPLTLAANSAARVVGESSPLSFEIKRVNASSYNFLLANNNQQALANGPFPVAVSDQIGQGTLVVISDSSFFTNSILQIADNNVLVKNLFQNSTVYIDTSHWPPNTVSSLRAQLNQAFSILSGVPSRYFLTLGVVGLVVFLFPIRKPKEKVPNTARPRA